MHEPRLGDDLQSHPPAAEPPSRKRSRTKGGQFAPAGVDTETLTMLDPSAIYDSAPALHGRASADSTAIMPSTAPLTGDSAGERVVFTPGRLVPEDVGPAASIVGSGLGSVPVADTPALIDAFPDLRRRVPVPVIPWHLRVQRVVREATRPGRIEAEHDMRIEALLRQIATRPHIVGVIGPKGGAGKSTTALLLGLVLAQYPSARPVLCEVNPDWGTLSELLGQPIARTIVDVLRDHTAIDRAGIGMLQGYQTMFGRLPVLTVPKDPEVMARLAPRDYDRVLRLLSVHYGLLLLDCGTSFTQVLNQYAIRNSDHLVVVGWPEQATMRMTLGAVEYLASSRYERDYRGVLAESARAEVRARALDDITLVVNGVGHAGRADPVDPAKIRAAAGGLNAVTELPHSPALRRLLADGTLTIEALPPAYRRAAKQVLVAVLSRLAEA
jgi:MinD-like ATPase involved in chromosome partitioning or flagellar assembly